MWETYKTFCKFNAVLCVALELERNVGGKNEEKESDEKNHNIGKLSEQNYMWPLPSWSVRQICLTVE